MKFAKLLITGAMLFVGASIAAAQSFPSTEITVVVPYQPGGSVDLSARLIAESMQKQFKVPVIVENRSEAGGMTAIGNVYRGKPDGYTLLATNLPAHIQPEVVYKSPFKLLDLTYIGGFVRVDMLLVVKKDAAYQTLKDVVEASKKKSMNASITSMGSLGHLTLLSLKKQAGLQVEGIPFRGNVPATTALAGGNVDISVLDEIIVGLHSDKIRAIASFSETRLPKYPQAPTAKELGYDISGYSLIGYTAPPGTPESVRRVLADAVAKAVNDAEVSAKAEKLGVTVHYIPGAEFLAAARRFHSVVSESKDLFVEKK